MRSTLRLSCIISLFAFILIGTANANYDYTTGRWLQRDPAGYDDGMNLYEYVSSQPVNLTDPEGLWATGDHHKLTEETFRASFGIPSKKKLTPCKKYMLDTLIKANDDQDNKHGNELERHYNRPFDSKDLNKGDWDKKYETYIRDEEGRFVKALGDNPSCEDALKYLGLLDHSLQDFYGHAMPMNAWTDKVWVGGARNPYDRKGLWPSSYPGEHPGGLFGGEPKFTPAEKKARYDAASSYVGYLDKRRLGAWWGACCCWCTKYHK